MSREIRSFVYGREYIPTSLAESSTCRLLIVTDDQIEVLRTLVNYAHQRRSWNDETIDDERYYMPSDEDWDDIEALVADLEYKLMSTDYLIEEPVTISVATGAAALPAEPSAGQTLLHVGQADGILSRILIDSFGNAGNVAFRAALGTIAAKTQLVADTRIGSIVALGYHSGSAYATSSRAQLAMAAAESWTSTAQGTYMHFLTTPLGSTTLTERLRINANGEVGVGMTPTYNLDVNGNFRCSAGFGCNGATPKTAVPAGANATDLASAIALVNQLKLALVANGICS